MRILGIESTAHTFGAGIVDESGVLANQKAMYEPEEGGIHPREAAEHHYAHARETVNNALSEAGLGWADLDGVAFSRGPGMPQCLDVGGVAARSYALKHEMQLYGVNHVIGHIEIGRHTTEADDPVVLFVSGGNSQVISYAGGRYRVFGETQDIAAGNALDKLARTMGIPHPGGPRIEELAAAHDADELQELSYVVKGMDFSFSGIVTEAQRMYNQDDVTDEAIAHAFQEHVFGMLVEASERAMAHLDRDELLLTGGVAANGRLQEMVELMAEDRGGAAYTVPHEYAMDNGAMIAWQGLQRAQHGDPDDIMESTVRPDWRADAVTVDWR